MKRRGAGRDEIKRVARHQRERMLRSWPQDANVAGLVTSDLVHDENICSSTCGQLNRVSGADIFNLRKNPSRCPAMPMLPPCSGSQCRQFARPRGSM